MKYYVYVLESKVNFNYADVAQLVEHILGKDEVTGSIPVISSLIQENRNERNNNFRMHRVQKKKLYDNKKQKKSSQ